jgi:N-acetylglucosamine-6-phosphate deacetylase
MLAVRLFEIPAHRRLENTGVAAALPRSLRSTASGTMMSIAVSPTPVTMTIVGGAVVGPRGVAPAHVALAGATIVAVGPHLPAAGRVVDAHNCLVAPGFIDLQVNGAGQWDLTSDPAAVWSVAELLPRYGVTTFLPTIVSAPATTYVDAIAALRESPPPDRQGAVPFGWHFEGPMLNPRRRGAHDGRWLALPDRQLYRTWSREAGVALVTLAPELPGAAVAVETLRAAGVVIAAGHTEATAGEVNDAIAAGVTYLTHLFNAMAPLGHRGPGPVGIALAGGPLVCGIIVDGVHVDPLVVRLAWRALGPERLNLVTDAVATAGGHFDGRAVQVREGGARLVDGTLAGSTLTMDAALRNLVAYADAPVYGAISTATSTPAKVLGLTTKGRVEAGADADLVVLTRELEVAATIVGGTLVHECQ